MEDWQKLTVIKLKAELTSRGLPATGNKAVLVERLTEDDSKQTTDVSMDLDEGEPQKSANNTKVEIANSKITSPKKENITVDSSADKPKSPESRPKNEIQRPSSPQKVQELSVAKDSPKLVKQERDKSPVRPIKSSADIPPSPKKTDIVPKATGIISSPKKTSTELGQPPAKIEGHMPAEAKNTKRPIEDNLPLPKRTKVEESTIAVHNFTRPLNIVELKSKLEDFGTVTFFWIDKIRSHCYATYETPRSAQKAKTELDGYIFQPESNKTLETSFINRALADEKIAQDATNSKTLLSFPEKPVERRDSRTSEDQKSYPRKEAAANRNDSDQRKLDRTNYQNESRQKRFDRNEKADDILVKENDSRPFQKTAASPVIEYREAYLATYDPFADTGDTAEVTVTGYIQINNLEFGCIGNVMKDEEWGDVIQLSGDQRQKVTDFLVAEGISKKDKIKIHGF
ncbi:Eukaryotic translation initiation factor eIF-1 [Terramyces sp. JEL0728]|nr:Eukaryotic translation initiation factor eIF-1 [Terramyces sp. JEL0728]